MSKIKELEREIVLQRHRIDILERQLKEVKLQEVKLQEETKGLEITGDWYIDSSFNSVNIHNTFSVYTIDDYNRFENKEDAEKFKDFIRAVRKIVAGMKFYDTEDGWKSGTFIQILEACFYNDKGKLSETSTRVYKILDNGEIRGIKNFFLERHLTDNKENICWGTCHV